MAVKAADQVSIVDVTDAYSVILTSEAYTFLGTTSAAKPGNCTTQVVCMQGADEVGFSIGSITCPTGISASVGTDGKTITITASSSMTQPGDVLIPITVNGTDVTITKRFSCGLALTGATGVKGDTGATGKGVKSAATTYQVGTSGTTAPTSLRRALLDSSCGRVPLRPIPTTRRLPRTPWRPMERQEPRATPAVPEMA